MQVYLIRHNQTANDIRCILDSNPPDAYLSDLDRGQVVSLVGTLNGVYLDAIYVSSLCRTGEAAKPLTFPYGVNPVELDGLREIEVGS